jgi:hypothetical protein
MAQIPGPGTGLSRLRGGYGRNISTFSLSGYLNRCCDEYHIR